MRYWSNFFKFSLGYLIAPDIDAFYEKIAMSVVVALTCSSMNRYIQPFRAPQSIVVLKYSRSILGHDSVKISLKVFLLWS